MVQLHSAVDYAKAVCADNSATGNSIERWSVNVHGRSQISRHIEQENRRSRRDKWSKFRLFQRTTPSLDFVSLAASLFLLSTLFVVSVDACNESICASIVSKCTLLRSCDCDIEPTGCSCCKKCFACLDFLQVECCSCVGLCPSPNATLAAGAPQKSVVADFEESVPQLWEALTDGEDLQGRWQKYTYPVDVKTTTTTATKKEEIDVTAIQETALKSDVSTQNCTVVFLSQCMAEKKCEISCRSMGASAYRWFTDGCCECVGHGCVSYGINESRCEMCSYDDDDDQLLPENISDEELERLEKLENLNNEESSSTPEEQVLAEPPTPPKKSKKTSTIVDV